MIASNTSSKYVIRKGKTKDIYDLGDELLVYFSDRVSAFDVVLPATIPKKGEYLLKLTVFWMKKSRNIFPNHMVEVVDNRGLKVLKAKRIDIEWIVRKYLYGSFWRMYSEGKRVLYGVKLPNGLRKAEELPEPIVTPTTKSDVGHDKEISKEDAINAGIIDAETWNELEDASLRLYEFYEAEAKKKNLIIADVKLEFGFYKNELIQIDEAPNHDTARIWPLKYYEVGKNQEDYCLDKEYLREYLRRIGFNGTGTPPKLPEAVIAEVAKRCAGAYKVIAEGADVDGLGLVSLERLIQASRGEK
ncbi:MAG: phosphoribosylaminoimidazolesuccinocarboxamide synthase [Thermoproteota archaeon]